MTATATYPWEQPPAGASAVLAADIRALLPRLETARTVLRAPVVGDFEYYAEIMMSERAVYMGGPMSRRDAWLDFTQCVSNWVLRGHGLWTITAREGGEVLGFVLICYEFGDLEPELGYFLRKGAEGSRLRHRGRGSGGCRLGCRTPNSAAGQAVILYRSRPTLASIRRVERMKARRLMLDETALPHGRRDHVSIAVPANGPVLRMTLTNAPHPRKLRTPDPAWTSSDPEHFEPLVGVLTPVNALRRFRRRPDDAGHEVVAPIGQRRSGTGNCAAMAASP